MGRVSDLLNNKFIDLVRAAFSSSGARCYEISDGPCSSADLHHIILLEFLPLLRLTPSYLGCQILLYLHQTA